MTDDSLDRPARLTLLRLAVLASILAALLVAPSPAAAAPPAATEITPPRPLGPLLAGYPPGASGELDVLLEITVASDGHVEDARALEGGAPFAGAAVEASKSWRFDPASRGGKPARARIRARVHFAPPSVAKIDPIAPVATPPAERRAPASTKGAEIEVTIVGEPLAPGSTALSRGEVRVLPGAFGDPFRAVEALPGVTPMFSGLPYFYVRGAPPGNVGYFLDGIRVPALFHLLAGPAVVPPALIERVELFPGGYPAQYGRFAGGIVAGETRAPEPGFHAEGTLRLIDAGALVEAPLPGGLGSALAGARYSYTAPVVTLFAPDFRVDYWDYQGRLSLRLSPRERLTIFAFGSHDYSAQRVNGAWAPIYASEFHRVDLRYDARAGDGTQIQHAVTLGLDRSNATASLFTPNDSVAHVRDLSLAARSRVVHRVSDAALVRAGMDATLDSYTVTAAGLLPLYDVLFPSRQDLAVGLYADAVIDAGRGVEITPGARLDLWGSRGATALSVDPRLSVRLPVGDRVRVLDAVGLAHQAPGFALPVPGVSIGGLQGGLQRSFQVSGGVEADLPLGITGSATLFYNAFFNLSDPFSTATDGAAAAPSVPSLEVLNHRSLGSGVGMEIYLRRKLTERLGGFVAYTLSRSTRHVGRESFAAQFDRTHVLQAALSWDIGRGLRVGSRVVFYTGTPIEPFYVASNLAAAGMHRLPPFFRLDARAEKRWTLGARGWISLVIEVQNATLSKEPNGVQCNSGLASCEVGYLGPITLPSLGVEGGL
jgi:TonB family protein